MTTGTVLIYALIDPRNQAIRYVGKTRSTLKRRLSSHVSDCRRFRNHRTNWVRSLTNLGLRPNISLLEEVPASQDWQEAERRWIAHFREAGVRLTNSTSGGEADFEFTPDVLARMSAIHKGQPGYWTGRKFTAEHRANMSAGMKGRPSSNKGKKARPETIAKMSARMSGKPGLRLGIKHTPESIAKMSAAKKGKPNPKRRGKLHTPEARARISAGHMGQKAWNKGKKMPPEIGARLSALLKGKPGRNKGSKFSPEACENLRVAAMRRMANGNWKQPMDDPEVRALQKSRMQDPEVRAKRSAASKAAWARRKASTPPAQLPLEL